MRDALHRFGRTHEARLLAVAVILFVFPSLATKKFLSVQNGIDLMTSYAFSGMLAAGLVVVLVAGGLDISFTAVAPIAQYLAVSIASKYDVGWIGLFAVALSVGTLLGLLNGSDARGNPYILNMQMLGLVLSFAMSWVLMSRTSVGRQLRALGGNPEAAKRVGFNVPRLNMVAYGYMGFCAGLESLVQARARAG